MTFSVDLSKAVKGVKENRDKIIRGTLLSLSSNIIKRTPVGNPSLWAESSLPAPKGYVGGSLRGAWQASFNAPDFSRSGAIETDNSGGQTAVRVGAVLANLQMGQTFYLTNPLPYAERVEFGWSRQRPQGMLRVSITEAQQILDNQ